MAHPGYTGPGVAVPSLAFSRPGEPLKILVETSDQQMPYVAMPASSSNDSTINRPLTPWTDSARPGEFTWPIAQARITQATGPSHYRFTVQEVGPQLRGEQVQLLLLAPLSFKTFQPGYGWLWALFSGPVLRLCWPLWAWFCYGSVTAISSAASHPKRAARCLSPKAHQPYSRDHDEQLRTQHFSRDMGTGFQPRHQQRN